MYSFIVYGTTFIIPVILATCVEKVEMSKQMQKLIYILICLIPSITAGLRYDVGTDYFNYLNMFKNTTYMGINSLMLSETTEPLFKMLQIVVYSIFNSYQMIFFFSMFITMCFIVAGSINFKEIISLPMLLSIFFLYYYIEGLNIIRQVIAISIVFYSLKYLFLDRSFRKYFRWIIIATLFHNTAIFTLVFFIIPIKPPRSFRKKIFFLIFLFFSFSTAFIPSILINIASILPVIGTYFIRFNFMLESSIASTILRMGPFIIVLFLLIKKLLYINDKFFLNVYLLIFAIGISFSLMQIPYGWRIQYYLVLPQLIVASSAPRLFNKIENKVAYSSAIIFTYVMFFVVYYVYLAAGDGFPYNSII